MLLCQRSMTRLLAEGTKYVISKSIIIVYTCKKEGLFTNFLRHGSRTSQPEPNLTEQPHCIAVHTTRQEELETTTRSSNMRRIIAFGLLGQLQIFLPWPHQGIKIAVLIRKNDGKTRIIIAMSTSSYVFLLGTSIRFSMIACSCEGFVLCSVFIVILICSRTRSKLMEWLTWSKLEGARHTTSQNRLENQENAKQNENTSELNLFHHWAFIERNLPRLRLIRYWSCRDLRNIEVKPPSRKVIIDVSQMPGCTLSWNIHCPNVDVFCLNPPFLSLQISYSKKQQKRLSPWLQVQKSTPPPNIHKI